MEAGKGAADRQIAQFSAFYQRIEHIIDRKLLALAHDRHGRAEAIATLRWELVRLLREYQIFKHTSIFDPFIHHGDQAKANRASALKQKCLEAGEVYKAHVKKWSVLGSESDWVAYERDLRAVVQSLHAHLAIERIGVRQLLH